ncbi:MAG: FGGY family carbohydrate kinase, partial [Lachnospiraceae bacterium]|nr:FGGY family carbohydrate kinase [Lachnospiraceae bacterium]
MTAEETGIREQIVQGKTVLGIEFGSTRIKGVLTGVDNAPVAQGSHEWENRLENGIWTYSLEDIRDGLQDCYRDLCGNVEKQYGVRITSLRAIGISAMMHGYLAFDGDGRLLVPFRTWRNTITEEASERLTALFSYHIPQRWSIAHLYQAILNGEEHVPDIRFITTLAGYVHWQLTGRKVLGVGDASGMFPIDPATADYNSRMIAQFDGLVEGMHYPWKLRDILPASLKAGEEAGLLTEEGAELLDPSGSLQAGIPLCPPEGDAGTGMAATNSVAQRTGNVSAGTSVFSMVVLEKPLSAVYPELDIVTTPTGDEVAMVHCNNCTSDLNAWVNLFDEFCGAMGIEADKNKLYGTLYRKAMEGDADCGG